MPNQVFLAHFEPIVNCFDLPNSQKDPIMGHCGTKMGSKVGEKVGGFWASDHEPLGMLMQML